MPSSSDKSGAQVSRRDFVAAAAAAAVGSRGIAPIEQGLNSDSHPSPRAPNAGFDPWLEVDQSALTANARAVSRLTSGRPIIAVVKNNAYGLGLETAGRMLAALPEVSLLAVVRADEALTLRKAGVRKPILLMGPATEDELLELVPKDIVQAPYRDIASTLLARVAKRTGRPVRVHLYIDTGMHRMGMPADQAIEWAQSLGQMPGLKIEGAFTELTEDADFDRQQAARLRELQTAARQRGVTIPMVHAASSDAVMHQTTETFLDAVRTGLALYGGYVDEQARQRGELRAAYRLKARVIRVDHLAAGEGVS